MRYDFIVHTDTLRDDLHYILSQANPNEDEKSFWIGEVKNASGKGSNELLGQLLRELPRSLVEEALAKYVDDYKMFGYDMQAELDKYYTVPSTTT